mmetsp:Transcript_57709/g.159056  ORF Transcript_57709/g.159056 Transcript_57709/m.159056 type:complete len:133 (+) Transcript_57709:739-1137(+)
MARPPATACAPCPGLISPTPAMIAPTSGIETLKYLHLSGNDGLKHMLPSYLHEDSKTCVFILKLLNDQRCEVRDLKTRNQELEELAKNKEEYNLRIQDEVQDLQDEFDRQLNIFPRSFVNLQKGFGASCTVS